MNTYNPSFDPKAPVYVAECQSYDEDAILGRLMKMYGSDAPDFSGKRVVIKPNLVSKRAPDEAVTVNPAVLSAVIRWLHACGADDVTIAESPGGVYNASRLRGIYSASGVDRVAATHGVALNYDVGYSEVSHPTGKKCRLFEIIAPIVGADVIIDVCKLKTHALTGMSAAVKNLFGTVPGVVKFEMHSRYPDYGDFSAMLCDLCELLAGKCEFYSVTDGIVGMEGNGPTAGTPRHIGALIVSRNPFAADTVASHLIGCEGKIDMLNDAAERGYTPATHGECNVVTVDGADTEALRIKDYRQPDSSHHNTIEVLRNLFGGRIYKLFEPYPIVDYKACLGCGECAASCPQHTIKMLDKTEVKGAGKCRAVRVPSIERDACIRCFCCQELCPHGVIKIKKNPITRILS